MDRLFKYLTNASIPVGVTYTISMLIWPWVGCDFSWQCVQGVWDRWQGLNVGMLAFLSSITAFNISRYNAERQRERNFQAAKAFLPSVLSELTSYFRDSGRVLVSQWDGDSGALNDVEIPHLSDNYKHVIENCIRHANPTVGDYLAEILADLQVHHSRLRDSLDGGLWTPDRHNLVAYMFSLAKLQARINRLFPFARNREPFNATPLDFEDYRNAISNLSIRLEDIHIDDEMNLRAFTERAVQREGGNIVDS